MLLLFELLNGSFEVFFLSLVVPMLFTIALGTLSFFTLRASATSLDKSKTMIVEMEASSSDERSIIDQVLHQLVKWLQRTVRRKEGSEDDHFLFIP
ncbi:hypothetical protein LCM20_04085 [Halobacillus litoralis]|uniref:hypothetical protein n=1 Tax=Halobacillus litoralis TaxID=45668 RepID=UPI001CD455A9|nr:hypothetical protein [Halobacillus litoralis]MCA0969774.1 hypothetical protein [Halobacillus litoralis]